MRRPNGNELDRAVCERIKMLSADNSSLRQRLEDMKKTVKDSTEECKSRIETMRTGYQENEKQIAALVLGLTKAEGEISYDYINQQIAELHEKNLRLNNQIAEWEQLSENRVLSGLQFDMLRDTIIDFGKSYDQLTVEQKRVAIRMCVERVEWDGVNVDIYLFGAERKDREPVNFNYTDERGNVEPLQGGSFFNTPRRICCGDIHAPLKFLKTLATQGLSGF